MISKVRVDSNCIYRWNEYKTFNIGHFDQAAFFEIRVDINPQWKNKAII